MASLQDITDAYDLSPNQQRLLARLKRGSTVQPKGSDKRSMAKLVRFKLAKENEPGVFIAGKFFTGED